MADIETIVEDIYSVLDSGNVEITDEQANKFGHALADVIRRRLSERENKGGLRMSNIGQPCNRKLYYTVNSPEDAEPLRPNVRLKFLFGDIIEELLLFLAELSGHKIEGRQDTQEIEGIKGHRDAVIDGEIVDVKSASTYSFRKFEEHNLADNDPFGYIDQIQSYLHAGQDDPIVTEKRRAHFLVVDKTLGNICLDTHSRRTFPIEKIYQYKKEMVSRPEPPARGFDPEPDGKSGNMKLGLNCSYCDFSKKCWPEGRTFLYANKPVTLVKVVREPKVPELTHG